MNHIFNEIVSFTSDSDIRVYTDDTAYSYKVCWSVGRDEFVSHSSFKYGSEAIDLIFVFYLFTCSYCRIDFYRNIVDINNVL